MYVCVRACASVRACERVCIITSHLRTVYLPITGFTPLHLAAIEGHEAAAEELLARGGEPNGKGGQGKAQGGPRRMIR